MLLDIFARAVDGEGLHGDVLIGDEKETGGNGVHAQHALPAALADDFADFLGRVEKIADIADPDAFAAELERLRDALAELQIDPKKSALAEQLEAAMAGAVMRALESSSSSTKPVSTAEAVRP